MSWKEGEEQRRQRCQMRSVRCDLATRPDQLQARGWIEKALLTVSQVLVATLILSSPPSRKTRASSVTSRRSFNRSRGVNLGAASASGEPGGGVDIIEWSSCSLVVMACSEPARGKSAKVSSLVWDSCELVERLMQL